LWSQLHQTEASALNEADEGYGESERQGIATQAF